MKFKKENIFLGLLISYILVTVFLPITCTKAMPPKKNLRPSDYASGISWKEAQKSTKPIAINFYTDWCSACRKFAPTLEKLRREYSESYNFVMIDADNPKNDKVIKQFHINGYPSFYLVDTKNHKKKYIDYSKYRSLPILRKELNAFLKESSK